MAFTGVDYYRLDDLLTEEQKLVRQTVREFVEREVVPIIEQHYREGTFPMHLVPKMRNWGCSGSHSTGVRLCGRG
jgi:glutaryl-CoA dehydrogenase